MVEMDSQNTWNYPIPYELLTTSEYIVLANKENLLDENYVPEDLVKLTCRKISSDPIQMREVAAQALSDMFDAAKADGVTLYAHSGYRSYRTQNTMYSNRLKKNNGKDDGVVAYPGSLRSSNGAWISTVINKAGIGKRFTSAFARHQRWQVVAENCWNYGLLSVIKRIRKISPKSFMNRGICVMSAFRLHSICTKTICVWKNLQTNGRRPRQRIRPRKIDMKIIDISQEIYQGMPVYPGDPTFQSRRVNSFKQGDMCEVSEVTMGTHCGTHVDAPLHMLPDGQPLECFSLECFIGPCRVLTVPYPVISEKTLEELNVKPGERILLRTDPTGKYNKHARFNPAVLSMRAAQYLAAVAVKLVGIERRTVENRNSRRRSSRHTASGRHSIA